jgi:hypothetical protein
MGKYRLEVDFKPKATRAHVVEMLRLTADRIEKAGPPDDNLNALGSGSQTFEVPVKTTSP